MDIYLLEVFYIIIAFPNKERLSVRPSRALSQLGSYSRIHHPTNN